MLQENEVKNEAVEKEEVKEEAKDQAPVAVDVSGNLPRDDDSRRMLEALRVGGRRTAIIGKLQNSAVATPPPRRFLPLVGRRVKQPNATRPADRATCLRLTLDSMIPPPSVYYFSPPTSA